MRWIGVGGQGGRAWGEERTGVFGVVGGVVYGAKTTVQERGVVWGCQNCLVRRPTKRTAAVLMKVYVSVALQIYAHVVDSNEGA